MKVTNGYYNRQFLIACLIAIFCSLFISFVHAEQIAITKLSLTADSTSVWPHSSISVCWENPASSNTTERVWVQEAVNNTWERYGNIKFTGWGTCSSVAQKGGGIRIKISDENPHVKRIGKHLDGMSAGMVLNFTFTNWECSTTTKFCIEAIAVHEFGHALGFAHEQNRLDAPEWCRADAQGPEGDWYVTKYDLNSIMNYCNPNWNNAGLLSTSDIDGIQALYPRFVTPTIDPNKWYRMVTRVTAQCIHVQHANKDRRNALMQWECLDEPQFYFRFEPVDGNLYRIRSRYNKCFHVKSSSTAPRTPLWQWECLNKPHFYFRLERTQDDWYRIRSTNGMCFHVAHGPNKNRREPLWQWECLNQPQFYFKFVEKKGL